MRLRACLLLLTCSCSSGFAATLHVDTFASTTQGWSGGSSPTRQASGGPAGAGDPFLLITSTGGNLASFNSQPAWIGNLTAIGAARVKVDLMSPPSSAPLGMRLVLFGPGSTDDRWTSATAQSVPNDGVWRHYTFRLSASDLVRVQGLGAHAELLASTLRVMLRHDPGIPSGDGKPVIGSLGIDNVELAGVPEPTTAALIGGAFSAAAVLRGKRA